MTASRSKPRFVRRGLHEDRLSEVLVPFTDDELAIVEAEAETFGLSVEEFIMMRVFEIGEAKGNA